jgi:hypothetical protein
MRMGQFSRTSHDFGPSLSVVKPANNNPGSTIPIELLDPSLALTEAQQREMAGDIRDLFNMYRGEREYYT